MTGRHSAALSLGSNLGDRRAALQGAVHELDRFAGVRVVAVSGVYETEPVGGPAQDRFLNAVVLVETELAPQELLAVAFRVEEHFGRVRGERWGPRTLDVDLLAFDDLTVDEPGLQLPHPRAHERAFVLVPWVTVEPHRVLPEQGSLSELVSTVDRAGVVERPDLVLENHT